MKKQNEPVQVRRPRGVKAVLFGIQLTLVGVILALAGAGLIGLIPAGLGLIVSYYAVYDDQ